jgi:RNA polymerase sigma-70 factor (ECF subfamily)
MPDPEKLTEAFFRHEAGRLVASLVRSLGAEHMQLAEDVVQEALLRALRIWPYYGVPENPAAWITLTAKNLALDALRRQKVAKKKETSVYGYRQFWKAEDYEVDLDKVGQEVEDAVLRLLFVCCHPSLAPSAQLALSLRTLCGLSVAEISAALLSTDQAVARRITRAKDRLREMDVDVNQPLGPELHHRRVDTVLKTLYLMFNEGYKSAAGTELVRIDLCEEAMRLTRLVTRMALPVATPHALLALMCFQHARHATRTDSRGNLLTLAAQDRSRWDKRLIQEGMAHLGCSAMGDQVTPFHLQAAIAGLHCAAESYEATDWVAILKLYDSLVNLEDTPVTRLNRAVAVGRVKGPVQGLKEALPLAWNDYYLWHAVIAEMQMQSGDMAAAAQSYHRAATLAA